MITEILSATVIIGILTSGIRLATPYLYAAIGEAFGQRSGVLNLGVDADAAWRFPRVLRRVYDGESVAGTIGRDGRWRPDGLGNGLCNS